MKDAHVNGHAQTLMRAAIALQTAALEWSDDQVPAHIAFEGMDAALTKADRAVKAIKQHERWLRHETGRPAL